MKAIKLKVGDRIRIVSLPGYEMHPMTRRAYKKLLARPRAVCIHEIDKDGLCWFRFRLREKDGLHTHFMAVEQSEDHWVKVKPRRKMPNEG